MIHHIIWSSNAKHIWTFNSNLINIVCLLGLTFSCTNIFIMSINNINEIYLLRANENISGKCLIIFNSSIALFSGLSMAFIVTKLIKNT